MVGIQINIFHPFEVLQCRCLERFDREILIVKWKLLFHKTFRNNIGPNRELDV